MAFLVARLLHFSLPEAYALPAHLEPPCSISSSSVPASVFGGTERGLIGGACAPPGCWGGADAREGAGRDGGFASFSLAAGVEQIHEKVQGAVVALLHVSRASGWEQSLEKVQYVVAAWLGQNHEKVQRAVYWWRDNITSGHSCCYWNITLLFFIFGRVI